MPLYDYKCEICNQKLAILRNIKQSDVLPSTEEEEGTPADPISPHTDRTPHVWKRAIGAISFQLMGYGWYKDGY